MSKNDDKILQINIVAIETAFSGNKFDDIISVWVSDEAGASYSLNFSQETAKRFRQTLERALSGYQQNPPTH